MSSSNRITKVAVVGAGGHSGGPIVRSLLEGGAHTVTAITREGSDSKLPDGIAVKKIDYGKPETLVAALKGQDALVITLSGRTGGEVQEQLIRAAGEAGVPWILPNDWSPDSTDEASNKDVFILQQKADTRQLIKSIGKSSYIDVVTGFWYEWSLAIAPSFGFDFAKRELTYFDDGETKISVSTWPQVGRAVAALLSLPIKPEGSNKEASLEHYRDQLVYINSFTLSQKEMLQSVLRVTGAKENDWTITTQPAKERYAAGVKEMQEGNRMGFLKMMYVRVFYPDGTGDYETGKGTLNKLLGLPKEDLDAATEVAVARSKGDPWK